MELAGLSYGLERELSQETSNAEEARDKGEGT